MARKMIRSRNDIPMIYFGFGSNLLEDRLHSRVRYVQYVCNASLRGWKLNMNFLAAIGGGGKCDITETGDPNDVVWGALYRMPWFSLRELDNFEGVPFGLYERKLLVVESVKGRNEAAIAYIGRNAHKWTKASNLPFDWYKRHVVLGAQQKGLPAEYIAWLESIPSTPDWDRTRYNREAQYWS